MGKVCELLSDPTRWTKSYAAIKWDLYTGDHAESVEDVEDLDPGDLDEYDCYCTAGAIRRCYGDEWVDKLSDVACVLLRRRGASEEEILHRSQDDLLEVVVCWNDHSCRSHYQIVEVLEEAGV